MEIQCNQVYGDVDISCNSFIVFFTMLQNNIINQMKNNARLVIMIRRINTANLV